MGELSDRLKIDTPENILLDAEIAGFGSRCIAAIIDYVFIFLIMIAVFILFMGSLISRPFSPAADNTSGTVALYIIVQFTIITFYHLFFELIWNGQTPGKRRTGLRVVQANGLPVTASGVIIRNLVRLFDFLPLMYGVGLAVMFMTRTTQRLGDLAARTVVIRERKQLALDAVREDLHVQYVHFSRTEPIPHYIHIDRLSQDDRRTVVDYLQRRATLNNRAQVAPMLARQMHRRMDASGGSSTSSETRLTANEHQAELFLEQIARAFELFDPAARDLDTSPRSARDP